MRRTRTITVKLPLSPMSSKMRLRTIPPRRLVDGFTFDDDDKKERPCVAASKREIETWQKEHPGNGFDLKVFSDTLKKYADELGLAFGDIYYYLDVEDDKADEMGVRV